MLWNALAALATAAAGLVGMQIGVRQALQHELDRFLVDDLQTISDALTQVPVFEGQSPIADLKAWYRHPRHGRFIAIYDENGRAVWVTTDHLPPTLSVPRGTENVPFLAGDYRVIEGRIINASGVKLTVRTGIPMAALRDEVAQVDLLALIVAACMAPIALEVGWILAGRVTTVLGAMTDRAARLRPPQLGERLPIRGVGDEIDQLAIEFNRLLDRLAAELVRREAVLANTAHELRTPVATIRSCTEVALASPRTATEYEAVLTDVIEECESLEELLRQLLLLSECEADRLRLRSERVSLDRLVIKTAATFAPAAEANGVMLAVQTVPAPIEGSPSHLRQVLNNLLDNATRHVPSGGQIVMAMAFTPDRKHVHIMVRDDGCGIPAEEQPRVFERFYRCQSSRSGERATKGFGLGLAICKAIVEAHGGEIDLTSTPGQGTEFRITLPLSLSPSGTPFDGSHHSPPGEHRGDSSQRGS